MFWLSLCILCSSYVFCVENSPVVVVDPFSHPEDPFHQVMDVALGSGAELSSLDNPVDYSFTRQSTEQAQPLAQPLRTAVNSYHDIPGVEPVLSIQAASEQHLAEQSEPPAESPERAADESKANDEQAILTPTVVIVVAQEKRRRKAQKRAVFRGFTRVVELPRRKEPITERPLEIQSMQFAPSANPSSIRETTEALRAFDPKFMTPFICLWPVPTVSEVPKAGESKQLLEASLPNQLSPAIKQLLVSSASSQSHTAVVKQFKVSAPIRFTADPSAIPLKAQASLQFMKSAGGNPSQDVGERIANTLVAIDQMGPDELGEFLRKVKSLSIAEGLQIRARIQSLEAQGHTGRALSEINNNLLRLNPSNSA